MAKVGLGIGKNAMVTRGVYKLVRHPIMTGFFIMFFCVPVMTVNHMFFSVACTAYILLAVYLLEERDLLKNLEGYKEYKRITPAFCPFFPTCAKKDPN